MPPKETLVFAGSVPAALLLPMATSALFWIDVEPDQVLVPVRKKASVEVPPDPNSRLPAPEMAPEMLAVAP